MLEKYKNFQPLPRHQRVDIAFEDLVYGVQVNRRKNEHKTLLKGISGQLRSSELTGIMGPSGAGKSTLMNVLAGYKIRNVRGTIKVNGKIRNLRIFREMSCYIMENDELLPHLTVIESMTVAANLKLSEKVSRSQKAEIIEELLDKLGLIECKDTNTDKLSKGQRKRLSIAQELVNNPPVMFFDEPTSGLDSQSCFQCISLLKSLAKDGRTIVCTIHQPSAKLFEMFDRLYVVADGMCIYKGTVPALLPYLKSQSLICPPYHNPADFVIEVVSGEYSSSVLLRLDQCVRSGVCEKMEQLCIADKSVEHTTFESDSQTQSKSKGQVLASNGVKEAEGSEGTSSTNITCNGEVSIAIQGIDLPPNKPESRSSSADGSEWRLVAAGPCTQFCVLFQRTIKSIMRDTYLTQLRLIVHISVGLLMGILYFGVGNEANKTINNVSSLFFGIMFIMLTAMMPTLITFPLEMAVFIREHLNCWYSSQSYFISKSMADVPFQVIFPIIYSTIFYWMTDQPPDATRFLLFLLLSILISLTSQSLGLLISAATSLQVAVFLGAAVAAPHLLFCGFFITFENIPGYLQWLTYLTYIRYAYEGMMLAIYGFNRPDMVCGKSDDTFCFMTDPKLVLEELDIKEANFWLDLIMLVVFFFVFRIACYFVLRWRISRQK